MKKALSGLNTFTKWLISYLVVLVLPSIVILAIAVQTISMAKAEIKQVYSGTLEQMRAVLDSEFEAAQHTAYSISSDERVHSLAFTTGAFTVRQYLTMESVQKDFQKYSLVNDIIRDIYLYFPSHSYALGSWGQYNALKFEEHVRGVYGLSREEYLELLEREHSNELVCFQGGTRPIFLMHSILPAGEGGGRALLLVELKRSKLEDQILLNNTLDGRMQVVFDTQQGEREADSTFSEEDLARIVNSREPFAEELSGEYLWCVPSSVQKVHYLLTVNIEVIEQSSRRIRVLILVSVLFYLIGGMLVAFVFSRRQYRPLQRLTEIMRQSRKDSEGHQRDEYQYLETAFNGILEEMKNAKSELDRQEKAMRDIALGRLLNGHFRSWEQAEDQLDHVGVSFSTREFIVISFIIQDDTQLFFEPEDGSDQNGELSHIIIRNIAEELVNADRKGCCTDLDEQILLITCRNPEESQADFAQSMSDFCWEIVQLTESRFNLLLCCTISEVHADPLGAAAAYREVTEMAEYVVFSNTSARVISWQNHLEASQLSAEAGDDFRAGEEHCSYFVSLIRSGAYSQALQGFDEMIDLYLPSDLNNLALAKCRVFGLVNQLLSAFSDIKQEFGDEFYNELDPTSHLLKVENISDLKLEINRILRSMIQYYMDRDPSPDESQAEKIKDYVRQHYADANLSAAEISEKFGMNPAYLSRFFKKETGMGMLDYIHRVRIREARRLMAETDDSIKSISERVGYFNSLTFIRAFKRQEGCTPGQYREAIKSDQDGVQR